MFGISISLASLLLITIALSVRILGDVSVFPFFEKSYAFSNIIVVTLLFIVFAESHFLAKRRKKSELAKNSICLKHRILRLLSNIAESLFFLILLLPFVAACRVFLAIEADKIWQPLIVFVFFIIVFRLNIFCLAQTNSGFNRFMQIFIILTFLMPMLGFCIWEFSGIPATVLSYLSPVWFLIEVVRSRFLVTFPFFIIWLLPTIVFASLHMFRNNSRKARERSVES